VKNRAGVARATGPAVVTAAEMVAGHVRLDISCLDRLYLNGYVNKLQTPGGVVYFFHDHRGKPIVSPALFEPIGEKFRRDIRSWAQASGIPVITFKAGDRKADVMAPYLQAAAAAGCSQVVALGCAQEFQLVWTARKRATDPGACPQFSFTKEQRRVSVFYIYIFDEQMGPGFIKICTYFPYPVKVWLNGHEWAKRQAAAAGIGFAALSNGFASADDPDALQQICDRFGPGTVQVWFERWMARIPLPLTGADRDAGYWWELSMRQVEISRTLVFDDDCHARAFFEALLCENMDLGRPENVELLFRRGERRGQPALPPPGGGFRTTIDRYCHMVTINVFYKNSRVKQYLKDGIALRIETVVNSPDKARRFEPTCARWRLKFTGRRAGCLGPGRPRRAGSRRGPCRGLRKRAWGPGWRRDRQSWWRAGPGFRCLPGPGPGPGTGPMRGCAGSWCEW
jgi:hypothetical protein